MSKQKQQWWRVFHRNEQGKIIDGCRQLATSRKAAKEQAAQLWGLDSIENLRAISDRDPYNVLPAETT
jgi:hypothetical protein